jgi:hypothetical protein
VTTFRAQDQQSRQDDEKVEIFGLLEMHDVGVAGAQGHSLAHFAEAV